MCLPGFRQIRIMKLSSLGSDENGDSALSPDSPDCSPVSASRSGFRLSPIQCHIEPTYSEFACQVNSLISMRLAYSCSMTEAPLVSAGLPVCVLLIASHQMPFEHCKHVLHRLFLPLVISGTVCYMACKLSGRFCIPLL